MIWQNLEDTPMLNITSPSRRTLSCFALQGGGLYETYSDDAVLANKC